MGLEVINLTVSIQGKRVLKNVSLKVDYGKVHAIMGPNGSGKSSLAYTIMGREGYEVEEGDIRLDGESLLDLETEERALKGIYLGMQEPPAIPGIKLSTLIIASLNKRRGVTDDITKVTDAKVVRRMYQVASAIGLPREVLTREVNVGFSGGEKKRSELLQAILTEPKVIILDEPDSGLDIDGIKKVAEYINDMRRQGKAVMLITHYARLLHHVKPDEVTVLLDGEVAAHGDYSLAVFVEERGYAKLKRLKEEGRLEEELREFRKAVSARGAG